MNLCETFTLSHDLPFISVIIPTYARPQKLQACLKAFAEVDYPKDFFEVVVVNDGGCESLEETVHPFREKINLILLNQVANTGPAVARNLGAHNARGELLAFTDDDCEVAPDWLRKMAACYEKEPAAAFGGHTQNGLPENLFSEASQMLIDYLYAYYHHGFARPLGFFCSNNFALPRNRFLQIGGFDAGFPLAAGEDRELCDRWRVQGFPMIYAPEARISHKQTLSFPTYLRQHFNYGRGAWHFRQIRARRFQSPNPTEPLSFYFNLIKWPFSKVRVGRAWALSILLILSQAANALGYMWEKQWRR